MNTNSVHFLPFHAINEFMRPDYRQDVIHQVLDGNPTLPDASRNRLNQLFKQLVKISGFRNSLLAPAPLKIKQSISAFESKPSFTAAVLAAWADLHDELRSRVHDLLSSRSWDLLPPDADRTRLPGFFTNWPDGETFEAIHQAYASAYPGDEANTDDISLMTVWLSVTLPYKMDENDKE